MIGWFSCLMSTLMVTNTFNVHYYERYVNLLAGTLKNRASSRDLRDLTRFVNHMDGQCRSPIIP
jgi:hypothetical protein